MYRATEASQNVISPLAVGKRLSSKRCIILAFGAETHLAKKPDLTCVEQSMRQVTTGYSYKNK